ncbi:hypothetical protein [Desulfolutivibrio sulfodismutans]|uniref:hypothetical protein n=1 Tax=Desulfolutivibrio sulfodismutans TaxID=63561 RepID=UPI00159D55C7|nr:hypothetical protein [Desulfolutivibrio sulfodismutans]QLA14186.1 hypothetical protein GD606_18895 [Desulfolutivibrio sulfodismutans DSM 3696]
MTMHSKIGSFSYDDERARGGGHDPVIVSRKLASGLGELPVGLILSRDQAGAAVPYEAVAAEAIGAGDGTDKTFSATLAKHPVQPGSVAVSDGVEDFADDGLGRLTGDAGGSGTINYATGAVAVEFHAAPANARARRGRLRPAVLGRPWMRPWTRPCPGPVWSSYTARFARMCSRWRVGPGRALGRPARAHGRSRHLAV